MHSNESIVSQTGKLERNPNVIAHRLKDLVGNERRRLKREIPAELTNIRNDFPDVLQGNTVNWLAIQRLEDDRYRALIAEMDAVHQRISQSGVLDNGKEANA